MEMSRDWFERGVVQRLHEEFGREERGRKLDRDLVASTESR